MAVQPSHLAFHPGRRVTARWRRGQPGDRDVVWVKVGQMPHPDPRWFSERSCDRGFGQVCDTEAEAQAVAGRWMSWGDWVSDPPQRGRPDTK